MDKRRTRTQQVERNRGKVLAAARLTFLAKGYSGATLNEISDEAGFSKGVVYSQFGGKGDLLLALLEQRIIERATQNEAAAAGAVVDGAEGVRGLLQTVARRSGEDAEWGRLLIEFRVVAARDDALSRRYAALHERTIDGFTRVLEQAMEPLDQVPPFPLRSLTELVLAIDNGMTLERAANPAALPDALLVDVFARLLGLPLHAPAPTT